MEFIKQANDIKLIFLNILIFVFFTGCMHRTEINNRELLHSHKNIFVYGHDDNLKINESIKKELTKIGYVVTENKSKAELIADFNYSCYYDVIHYTCTQINLFISDKESGEVLLHSKFIGDTPWSAETLVQHMFKRISKKLETN